MVHSFRDFDKKPVFGPSKGKADLGGNHDRIAEQDNHHTQRQQAQDTGDLPRPHKPRLGFGQPAARKPQQGG